MRMKTVKEVAEMTGIIVRTLQYYDEIGLLKPSKVTEAGYRLYDSRALEILQQILFFKELDFRLKEIKAILEDPDFNRIGAFKKQKELLRIKRDRLNDLISLLEKLEKGEACMSFREFDLSGYIQALEDFKNNKTEDVIRYWGSVEAFNDFIMKAREHESGIAKTAIKYYGSVEKYTAAMKENLDHFSERMEQMERIKENGLVERNRELTEELLSDLTRDVTSEEVQKTVKKLIELGEQSAPDMDMGENYWEAITEEFLKNQKVIEGFDKIHGSGAAKFMAEAYRYYLRRGQQQCL